MSEQTPPPPRYVLREHMVQGRRLEGERKIYVPVEVCACAVPDPRPPGRWQCLTCKHVILGTFERPLPPDLAERYLAEAEAAGYIVRRVKP